MSRGSRSGHVRGGLGVRKAMEEKIAAAQKYRLTGVRPGSIVSECLDRYGRWEGGYRLGAVMRNSVTNVTIQWEDEEEFTYYTAGDARYNVDRDRWRITPPRAANIFELLGPPKGRSALTSSDPDARIALLLAKGISNETEEEEMATGQKVGKTHTVVKDSKGPKAVPQAGTVEYLTRAQLIGRLRELEPGIKLLKSMTEETLKQMVYDRIKSEVVEDELEEEPIEELEASALDEVDDDVPTLDEVADELGLEVDEDEELDEIPDQPVKAKSSRRKAAKAAAPADGQPARETYTPKQVASRIGTDAKTLRKFFRSGVGTVKAVGQGGRYEFPADMIDTIRSEFDTWKGNKPVRKPAGEKGASSKTRTAPATAEVIEDDEEELSLDDLDEPEIDELEEIDEELDD
jgi:hypothetical protein